LKHKQSPKKKQHFRCEIETLPTRRFNYSTLLYCRKEQIRGILENLLAKAFFLGRLVLNIYILITLAPPHQISHKKFSNIMEHEEIRLDQKVNNRSKGTRYGMKTRNTVKYNKVADRSYTKFKGEILDVTNGSIAVSLSKRKNWEIVENSFEGKQWGQQQRQPY
jgi:hypothetical protein